MDDVKKYEGPGGLGEYPFDRTITVRTQFRDLHSYPDAPDQVAFLKGAHRHIFKVEATISVNHDNRDLEFFMVQDVLDAEIIPFIRTAPLGSCEQMAERIATGLIHTYGTSRDYSVTVSEDGENDATVTFDRVKCVMEEAKKAALSNKRLRKVHNVFEVIDGEVA